MTFILLALGLCLSSSRAARLKSQHSSSEHSIDTGQSKTSMDVYQHRLGFVGSALQSVFKATGEHPDMLAGNSMWLLVLILGILIGWFCFSCAASLWKASKNTEEEFGAKASSLTRFTRALRASVRNVMPQVISKQQEEEPEPERIILVDTLYRVPSAGKYISHDYDSIYSLDLPDRLDAWEPVSCALVEATDGLYMCVADEESESKTRLVQWSGNPRKGLEVDKLPTVVLAQDPSPRRSRYSKYTSSSGTSGGTPMSDQERDPQLSVIITMGDVNFNRHVSMRAIPTDHKVVSTLHPFVVRWGEGTSKSYLLVASEEEGTCSKWVKNLFMYSQIRKRFDGALLWKLNSDVMAKLPKDFEEAREFLADIRNWRRRLCFLEQLHMEKSLCITYLSEKADDGAVANILAKAGHGSGATIERLPEIPVAFMTSWDSEQVRSNALQYYISVFGSGHCQASALPTVLHGFQVSLPESLAASGGHAHSIYAFDDAAVLEDWLESMDIAIQELGKDNGRDSRAM